MVGIELRNVTVNKVPADVLEYLRPFAIRNGHQGSDSSVMRHAAIDLAKRLGKSSDDRDESQTGDG